MLRAIFHFAIAAMFPSLAAAAPDPVQVMVVGVYHFGNPGLDVNNMKSDNVLTPKRQAELASVAKALQTFRPTKVMVEYVSQKPDLAVDDYIAFTPEKLLTTANEQVQIAFRLAKLSGIKLVYGIDEQPSGDEPDYFPYDKLVAAAEKFGQKPYIDAASAPMTASLKEFEAMQSRATIGQLLAKMNRASDVALDGNWYANMLAIGDTSNQAGADLNAMWYLRNAKIFAKLMRAAKPGDRVIVVFGGGHSYWLRHFARETPGYRFIDPVPYLAKAR